jgi:DNA-binding transcriptional MocR family regulator
MWKPEIESLAGPKYLAIAEMLARDIEIGTLGDGDRLPPQRALAEALGVDLTTVTRAYGEAQRLGLIEGDGRRGSFVRSKPKAATRADTGNPIDPGMNAPPEVPGGSFAEAFGKSATALLRSADGNAAFQYQPSGGMPSVREAGATLLAGRGIPAHEDSVLVAAGGQHGLHAIFSAELKAGDLLAVPAFVYPGLLSLARRYGVILRIIPTDDQGIDPGALDAACRSEPLRALYLVPTNDNPTTVTMGVDRRKAIAEIADRHGLLVIEDDAYGLLPEAPLPPVASFVPHLTWHIASVSKILSPGLRVAWLRAPDIGKAWRLAADMHETAIMAPPLNAAVVADWVRSGVFDRIVGEVRAEAVARQALVRDCLPAGSYAAQHEGYHLWLKLPADADPVQIAQAIRPHGISAIPGDAFAVDRATVRPALRVSIGASIPRERLERGLRLLGALIGPDATRKISLI